MLNLQPTCMYTQKRGNAKEEYEDAWAYIPRGIRSTVANVAKRFRVALADGASESAFSEQWAKLLVDDYVTRPYIRPKTMLNRSKLLATQWRDKVRRPDLPWYIAEKIRAGAYSTLLGLSICGQSGQWRAISIGDTCLFQIRDGELKAAWPLDRQELFGRSPVLLSTNHDATKDLSKNIVMKDGQADAGDIFILATDALSAWFLEQHERAKQPWLTLARVNPKEFADWIEDLRSNSEIRNDDVTCIICRIMEA